MVGIDKSPGVYHGVSFSEYSQWNAINWHRLEPYRKSPLHGRWSELLESETSQAMEDGEAFHTAILEPERFAKDYAVMPDFEGHHNSNLYKNAKAAWLAQHAGQVDIDSKDEADLLAMQKAVAEHPVAGKIMAGRGRNEIGIVWQFQGVLLKARIDTVRMAPVGLIDLAASDPMRLCAVEMDFKTTRAIGLRKINNAIAEYGYGAQLAMQYDGLRTLNKQEVVPLICAVCKPPTGAKGPFDVVVCDMRPRLEAGRHLYRSLARKYVACAKAGYWPGAAEHVVPMDPNRYEVDPNEVTEEIEP